MLFEKLNEIKFHGKPVSIEPLINSIIPNKIEKIRKLINEAKGEDLIKIQRRHQQIGTLLNMRVSKLI